MSIIVVALQDIIDNIYRLLSRPRGITFMTAVPREKTTPQIPVGPQYRLPNSFKVLRD
jgi:hypothetical protein